MNLGEGALKIQIFLGRLLWKSPFLKLDTAGADHVNTRTGLSSFDTMLCRASLNKEEIVQHILPRKKY